LSREHCGRQEAPSIVRLFVFDRGNRIHYRRANWDIGGAHLNFDRESIWHSDGKPVIRPLENPYPRLPLADIYEVYFDQFLTLPHAAARLGSGSLVSHE